MHRLVFVAVTLTLLTTGVEWGHAQQRIDVQTIVKAADTNHDGYVDRVEYLRRMTEAFFFVDANKDGFLTNREIQQTIAGADPQRIASADTNVDGKLSMYEFQTAIAQSFDEADSNGDGLLSMEEIRGRWGFAVG
jgi:Ca2+-binding EF-hand superfamily protein